MSLSLLIALLDQLNSSFTIRHDSLIFGGVDDTEIFELSLDEEAVLAVSFGLFSMGPASSLGNQCFA